jgi:hypothetical protein
MKRSIFAGILLMSAWGSAQADRDGSLRQLLATTTPKATVVVREDTSGSDLVEITMLGSGFPLAQLQAIVDRLGQQTGRGVRGVFVYNTSKSGSADNFVKARFGTDNLIEPAQGVLNLQAIVRAFAGVPAPNTVDALLISFTDQLPGQNTIRSYATPELALLATVQKNPLALEYRVRMMTQDPRQLTIPERIQDTVTSPAPAQPAPTRPILAYVLIGVGSLAVGALVYFLAAASGSSRSRR